jgi:CheY-like chemotaxis protein
MRPGPTTLLSIDDDELGLRVRKQVLETAGYSVLAAASGAEGLRLFRSHAVDAVVLDYLMPGMDGGAVALEIKQISPSTPVLMLSAYVAVPADALDSVDLYVQKGQRPEVFLSKIRELLARRKFGYDTTPVQRSV